MAGVGVPVGALVAAVPMVAVAVAVLRMVAFGVGFLGVVGVLFVVAGGIESGIVLVPPRVRRFR